MTVTDPTDPALTALRAEWDRGDKPGQYVHWLERELVRARARLGEVRAFLDREEKR